MKTIKIELIIPDNKICKLPLLKRYIKRKLSAEYRITEQPRVNETVTTHQSKNWGCQTDGLNSVSSISS